MRITLRICALHCAPFLQDFGLLIDIDEFLSLTDGGEESLDYARFKELLAP
jgi:hypothetical protein